MLTIELNIIHCLFGVVMYNVGDHDRQKRFADKITKKQHLWVEIAEIVGHPWQKCEETYRNLEKQYKVSWDTWLHNHLRYMYQPNL